MITRQREPGEARPGEWSHRVWSPARPPTFERPVEEREIVRRKSFAFGPMSVEDAADALEDLDHEFFLFRDADTQADAVLYWRDDGLLALIESRGAESADYGPVHEHNRLAAPIALEAALGEMNEVGHRFLFFENAASGRGNILYRRYDGHYGLIEPVDNHATTAKDTVREAEVMCVAPDAGMAKWPGELAEGVRNLADAYDALAVRKGQGAATTAADRAIKNQRRLEHAHRAAMSALIDADDVREVTARRGLYRRLVRTSGHLASVAERVWYSVLKAS
jgi:hypothetical protein